MPETCRASVEINRSRNVASCCCNLEITYQFYTISDKSLGREKFNISVG